MSTCPTREYSLKEEKKGGLSGPFDLVCLQYSSSVRKTHSPSARASSPTIRTANSTLGLKRHTLRPRYTIYYSFFINFSGIKHEVCEENSTATAFYQDIFSSSKVKRKKQADTISYIVGKLTKINEVPDEISHVFQDDLGLKYYTFKKLLHNNLLYKSKTYKSLKTNSNYVKFENNGVYDYGVVQYYLKVCNFDCQKKKCNCKANNYAIVTSVTYS